MPDLLFRLSVIPVCMLAVEDLELIFFTLSSVAFLNRGGLGFSFSSLTWKQGQSPNMGILKLLTF